MNATTLERVERLSLVHTSLSETLRANAESNRLNGGYIPHTKTNDAIEALALAIKNELVDALPVAESTP